MTSLKLRAGARSTTVATVIAISALLGGGVALADGGVQGDTTSPAVTAPQYGCTEAEQAAKEVQKAQNAKNAADKAVEEASTSGDTAAYQKALEEQKKANEDLKEAQSNYDEAKDCAELPTHGSEIPGGTFPTTPTSGGVDDASETPGGNTPGSGVDDASTTPGDSGDSSTSETPGSGVDSESTTPSSGVAGESTYPCEESTPGGNNGGNTPGGSHSCTPCEYTGLERWQLGQRCSGLERLQRFER
jgi:hypothetical protein